MTLCVGGGVIMSVGGGGCVSVGALCVCEKDDCVGVCLIYIHKTVDCTCA